MAATTTRRRKTTPARQGVHADCGPIHVRASRGPAAVAAEIRRRLTPRYLAAVDQTMGRAVEDIGHQQARAEVAAAITRLFPAGMTVMPGHMQQPHRTEVVIRLPGCCGGVIRVSHDGQEAEFERFRVPASAALRMLTHVEPPVTGARTKEEPDGTGQQPDTGTGPETPRQS